MKYRVSNKVNIFLNLPLCWHSIGVVGSELAENSLTQEVRSIVRLVSLGASYFVIEKLRNLL